MRPVTAWPTPVGSRTPAAAAATTTAASPPWPESLGLEVARAGGIGWSATTLPEATAAAYAPVLAELEARLVLWRRQEAAGQRTSRNLLVCACGCPRRIRVAPSTLAQAPILCAACALPFTP
jgi:hypothetical protein